MTLVEMPSVAKAGRVAVATGWKQVASEKNPDRGSRRLDAGDDFEAHRSVVEEVSILFKLYESDTSGSLSQVPSGWTLTAAKFEVEWPKDPSVVWSHFGARRKAYNWALAKVKADLDEKKQKPDHEPVPWRFQALRNEWNRTKQAVAPWWRENSKESYGSGIADLVTALDNWKASKAGKRKGRKVGFPRFKSRRAARHRVRFTTGPMRLEADRRTIVLPVIGSLRSKENTRRVQRPLANGRAHILNMTLSERWGRLFVSVCYAARTSTRPPLRKPGVRAGVDTGLRTLATVADTNGNIIEKPNPAPLRATLSERRRVGRELSRRIPGSLGHRAAKAKLARLDRKAVHLRQEAWHQLTRELAATYSEVVIEDLDLQAMKRSMGQRAFRRSVSDAGLGRLRRQLVYKTGRTGSRLTVADRWFPSSQAHHGCGCRLEAPTRLAKTLICHVSSERVDRDRNAALNLRDWPEHASDVQSGASAPEDTEARHQAGTDPGPGARSAGVGGVSTRPRTVVARGGEAKTEPVTDRGGTPQGGAA